MKYLPYLSLFSQSFISRVQAAICVPIDVNSNKKVCATHKLRTWICIISTLLQPCYSFRMARPSSGRRKVCQCEICTATKPQGVEQPSATHAAHARDQRLRDQLLRPHSSRPNDVTTLQSTSSIPPPIDINLPNDTPSSAAGQDTNAGEHAANASSPPVDISDIIREARLEEVEEEINLRLSTLNDSQARLEFRTTPSEQKSFAFPDPEYILHVNYGQFALNTLNPHNRRFIEIEGRLCSLLRETQMAPPDGYSATRRLIEDALYAGLERLHVFKQRAWQSQSSDETSRYIVDNSKYHHFTMQPQLMKVGRYFRAWVRQDPTIASVLLGALVCYIQFQIPIRRMRFILACHRSVMRSLARRQTVRTVLGADILSRIPRDIHTVLSRYETPPLAPSYHAQHVLHYTHSRMRRSIATRRLMRQITPFHPAVSNLILIPRSAVRLCGRYVELGTALTLFLSESKSFRI